MRRRMMKSKIHRATVTDADLHYVGSITLDTDLMRRADIAELIAAEEAASRPGPYRYVEIDA